MAQETNGPATLMKLLGNRIRELRTQQHVSQKELGESCGIATERMELIEQGEIDLTLTTMIQLAQKLGMDVSTIFYGVG